MTAPDVVAAPVRERGYATAATDPLTWWTDLQLEKTPELRWPASLEVYESMAEQDGQVWSVLSAVVTPILRTPWRIDGTGCRPEVTAHVAADLGLPIVGESNDVPAIRTRGRFSWTEHLAIAVPDHLQYGHAVFEQVYYPAADDALLHLRKLGYRPARTIAQFNVARDGGLVSVQQYTPGAGYGYQVSTPGTGITLPVSRLVVYVNGKKGGNWIGRSVLRPAYKNWKLKDRMLRIRAQSGERNGMGIPVYTAAGTGKDEIEAGQEIVSGLRAGDESGSSIPAGAKLDLMGVSGTVPNLLEDIKYHDEQIARTVLAHFLNLGSQTGSWALGSTFADFFTLSIQAVAEGIRDTATRHVIEDLVDVNYGPDEPAPRLVFDEIGSRNDSIVAAVAQLVGAGVLKPDEDLEKFVRTALGLPPRGGAPILPPVKEAP